MDIKLLTKKADADGRHYYGCGTVQLIDLLHHALPPEEFRGFLKANVIKYTIRYNRKGKPKEDLAKAQQYLAWLVEIENECNSNL